MVFLYFKQCRFLFSFCFLLLIEAKAQPLSFHHLNTSDGLSENNVRSVAIDKNGFLWIGTLDGLNVYDGYQVTSFKKEHYPQIASNNVIHLTCDSRNRIWLGTYEGVTWVDGNRKFHRVVLNDTVTKFGCRTIMDTKKYGPVLYTSLGQFVFNEQKKKWEKLDWIPGLLEYKRFHDAEPFDENKIIYATDSLVMILDYANQKIVYDQPFTAVFSLCRYSDHELAIGLQHGKVQIADINTKEIVKEYQITSELNKKRINSTITEVRQAANGSLLIATDYAGLVIIDKAGNISNYTHDPINTNSIGANTTWRVLSGRNGDIVVGTNSAGVSIFNIYNKEAGYARIFGDGQGNFYDTYVAEMAEDKNSILWVGALERLMRWDKKNNHVKFFYYYSPPIRTGGQNLEIRSLCIDKKDRIWVSALGDGISILNETTGQFKKVFRDTSLSAAVKNNYILELFTASDGYIWVGTGTGIYTIHPSTLKINAFRDHPLLRKMEGLRVNAFMEDRQGNMWMATYNGVYRYNRKEERLDNFTTKQGLGSSKCFNLLEDSKGNLYIGTLKGFTIIANGKITNYDRTNGLKYDYCEGIMEDDQGKIWIANTKCIIRFNPEKGTMQYFGKNSGLSTEGFRMNSYLKSSTGELFWGSRAGINYFFPDQLINRPADLKVNIYQADMQDSTFHLGDKNDLSLKYSNNDIVFRFTAINLKGSKNIQYQYMLEGSDKEWQNGVDIRQARYSSLPAGKYVFKVKASLDGRTWINASNKVELTIIPPLWQQWWFIGGILAVITGLIYGFISNRNKKIKEQREEIEMEQAINYFASSMSEQQTEENILWDVAKNCIGRLQFEDCVIYLLDEEQNILVQKAAHGPKSPRQFEINKPIEIEPGKGIVGSVAISGKAEIISDTTKDPRYIIDDEQRYSEITVPVIYDGKVLGVIDCEHSKKRFFTQKHLSILTTIASLCANKMVRARAEEEKKEAQMILMSTQQKMTEVEMQALRAQMNPHFIFNCLNSINRYIVKSDQTTASLYLTKFAKLIRLILDNSNSKNVILTNELEALKLYIEMEALRFDKKFTYEIKVESNLGTDTVELPPLIIQPYVENAIWHGLLHKESNGHLSIQISMACDSMLQCII
ncbi:MAG TPA: two-component regulator propeller domain-containing protein, partial [Chitinophagaceae bacterium]|nr:two-component regulator propeller domain-containing protein [Chitinophagaceae bacterium]